jgi:RimJ/RimL family protein N-acetyltransferase
MILQEDGFTRAVVLVEVANEPSQRLFARSGYEPVGHLYFRRVLLKHTVEFFLVSIIAETRRL